MEIQTILTEEDRLLWSFVPLEHVGPLKFGMTFDQAEAAVRSDLEIGVSEERMGIGWVSAQFWHKRLASIGSNGPAVIAYYDKSVGLAAIAVDARRGPQVILEGMRLVGRAPSVLEDEFADYLEIHGQELRFSEYADPCSPQLGLVLRAQRAGDVVLSRPVMVAKEWTDRCWDTSEGYIPEQEWQTFV